MIHNILLIIFISCITQAAENDDPLNHPMVQEIFAQARLHTKPELAECETRERIEALLYREEQDVYDLMRKQCDEHKCYLYCDNRDPWGDDRDWDKALFDMAELLEFKKSGAKRPQDEGCVGERLAHFTRKYLRQSGINPDNVTITCDKDYFKVDPDRAGYAYGHLVPSNLANPKIAFNMDASMVHDFPHYVAAHEATHIKEHHGFKKHLYRNHYPYYRYPEPARKAFEASFLALTRVHEKQADLLPLLRFEGRLIPEQIVSAHMPICIKQFKDGTLNTRWNKSDPDATHPGCSELLPYILQIEKVKAATQKNKTQAT